MARIAVKDLEALAPGQRVSDENGVYWRKNKDGGATAYLRRKVGGKLVDTRLDGVTDTPRKADLDRIHHKALALLTKRVAAAKAAPEKQLGATATLAEVWDSLLLAVKTGGVWSERNTKVNVLRIQKHLEPTELWDRPINEIGAQDLLALLSPLRTATPDQEKKIRGLLSKTWVHAMALELVTVNPVDNVGRMLTNTQRKGTAKKHFPALVDMAEIRKLVKAIAAMNGSGSVRNALLLQAHMCQRSNEIAGAQWSEFDLDASPAIWSIPRARMKISEPESRGPHTLVLPPRVAAWLKTLPNDSEFVFPHVGPKEAGPIATGSLDKAMRTNLGMLGKHVPHGWRASMKTKARDAADADGRPLFNSDWVEAVLDHLPEKALEGDYIRAQAVNGGGRVLAWWCDQLEILK
jgi:integrase